MDRISQTRALNRIGRESPILFRSCGHETPFSDQKWASKIYAPQTKILEGGTKDEIQILD
jgi:hypothetical protein